MKPGAFDPKTAAKKLLREGRSGAHRVARFGCIVALEPQDILTDLAGAGSLVAAEAEIVAHINEDHAVRFYARRRLGAADGAWRGVGCDPEGLELQLDRTALRLPLPQRIMAPGPLRTLLGQLADEARTAN
jgi:hypothetical protein